MFEGVASWLLETYIGKYINVSPDKLSIGLLSGVIELENVQLKPDAFNEINDSPFELKFGLIGKIKFNMSLPTLRYTPWMLIAENLLLIIGPKSFPKNNYDTSSTNDSNNDQNTTQQTEYEIELNEKLKNQENKWFKKVELMGLENNQSNQSSSVFSPFLGSMAYSILKNLHVNLKNLHIRYEDHFNNFSFGANIESIQIKNENNILINEDFKENFIDNDQNLDNVVSKICEIKNFSLYSDLNLIYNQTNLDKLFETVSGLFTNDTSKINYLIRPTSFKSFLIQDISSKPLRKRKKPRIRVSAILKEFDLIINENNIKNLTNILKFINIYENKILCIHICKPLSISDHEENKKKSIKSWWLFLYKCVLNLIRRKLNKKQFIKWSKDVNIYRKAYEIELQQRLLNSNNKNEKVIAIPDNLNNQKQTDLSVDIISSNDLQDKQLELTDTKQDQLQIEKKRIESEWDFKRLTALRRAIFDNFINSSTYKDYLNSITSKSSSSSASQAGVYGYLSWFNSVRGYYFGKTTQTTTQPTELVDHNKIDDEVLGLINDSIENESLFRRDSLLAIIEFKIESFSILLTSASLNTENNNIGDIVQFKFQQSKFLFEALPRYDSYLFEMNMKSFYLIDCSVVQNIRHKNKKKNNFPIIIYPRYDSKLNEYFQGFEDNERIYFKNLNESSSNNKNETVFQLIYEHKPLNINQNNNSNNINNKKYNANLVLKSCGLDIVYNLDLFEKLKYFSMRINEYYKSSMRKLVKTSSMLKKKQQLNDLKFYQDLFESNDNKLFESQSKISPSILHTIFFEFEIQAPKIIIPIDIYDSSDPDIIIFDFGRLTFSNHLDKLVNEIKASPQIMIQDESDDSDSEDIYETPTATPPNELIERYLNDQSNNEQLLKIKNEFYSNYDLNFNELQVICGKLNNDNLKYYINKGHSRYHLLEKFDINIQIKLSKIKIDDIIHNIKDSSDEWPFLKIDINLNLLKLNIDDLKLVNYYKALENIQRLFQQKQQQKVLESSQQNDNNSDSDYDSESITSDETEDQINNKIEINKELEKSFLLKTKLVGKLLKFNLKLNELNMTISAAKTNNESSNSYLFKKPTAKSSDLKSLCELKIYSINSNLSIDFDKDINLKLCIFNLLLIDARQIYGIDYQLLAASHSNLILDKSTGQIINKSNEKTLLPLINIDVSIRNNNKEFIFDSSFSTLDIVLNPETISEIVLLIYSVYLNFSTYQQRYQRTSSESNFYSNNNINKYDHSIDNQSLNSFMLEEDDINKNDKSNDSTKMKPNNVKTKKNKMKSKINFKFNRLSVLMFRIEDQDLGKARKIALFDLNGVLINAVILSELNYLNVISNFDGLNITDLKENYNDLTKSNIVFGIGLENDGTKFPNDNSNDQTEKAFEICYKKYLNFDDKTNKKIGRVESELLVQTASVCYVHSSKLLYDLEHCFKDFRKFHAKIMEDVTEKATEMAMRFLRKGQNYLESTIADLYQRNNSSLEINNLQPTKSTPTSTNEPPLIKIKILFKTPVVAIPRNLNSSNLLVAHLGHIKICNAAASEENDKLIRSPSHEDFNCGNNYDEINNLKSNKISDSTKFTIYLFDTSLFSIDSEQESEYLASTNDSALNNNKSNLLTKKNTSPSSPLLTRQSSQNYESHNIKTNFKIFYIPNYAEKLIEKTNIVINFDYLPKFNESLSSSYSTNNNNNNINGAYLHLTSKISNTCKINLSKAQLEQLIETMNNVIYNDKSKIEEMNEQLLKQDLEKFKNSFEAMPSLNLFFTSKRIAASKIENNEDITNSPFNSSNKNDFFNNQESSSKLSSMSSLLNESLIETQSTFNTTYFDNISNINTTNNVIEANKLDFTINVSFKIEKLLINFLADVEKPNQEIAELDLNAFKLLIEKSNKYITSVQMCLMSLNLVDKLNKTDNSSVYHLLTSCNRNIQHNCKNMINKSKKYNKKLQSKYLYYSLPNLSNLRNQSYKYHRANLNMTNASISSSNKKQNTDLINNFYKLTKFYENSLSTSLPSDCFKATLVQEENKNDNKLQNNNEQYPSTPPPSPTLNKKNGSFFNKSESTSDLVEETPIDLSASLKENRSNNIKLIEEEEVEKEEQCEICTSSNKPLVNIKIDLVDEKHHEFNSKYKKINKSVCVKFSYLQLTVNPETWIILLDLLGFGAKVYPIQNPNENVNGQNIPNQMEIVEENDDLFEKSNQQQQEPEKKSYTGVDFEVKQFSIQLNQNGTDKKLARFSVDNVNAFIESRCDFLKVKGKLGSLSIYDMSDYNNLYAERFLTSGKQALVFEFFKYLGPMETIRTSYDYESSFKLKMNTVKYIHTQRFITTLTNYFQQFNQLQDALGRMKALSIGTKNISFKTQRSSRIKLDISTGAPIVIVPINFKSEKCLIINLGSIKIKNKFLTAGREGTLAHKKLNTSSSMEENEQSTRQDIVDLDETNYENYNCLLDVMSIQFTDAHIYSALRYDLSKNNINKKGEEKVEFDSFLFKQTSNIIMKQKKNFHLHLEKNLENDLCHNSPEWSMYAKLTSVIFQLDIEQYKLIRGLLDQNIGEPLNDIVNNNVPNLVMQNNNLVTVLSGRVWKTICIQLDLKNVGIELFDRCLNEDYKLASFAYLGFETSSLIYESNSDGSKLIDLVSNDIIISDKRNNNSTSLSLFQEYRSNKFRNILCKKSNSNSSNSRTNSINSKRLLLEIHFRSNKISNRYSILISNCRVITILDWLTALKNFLGANAEPCIEIENKKKQEMQLSQQPIEIKLNLTETDFVLVENCNSSSSQAIILRITAFLEYNQRKLNKPFNSCLQQIEFFSCYMNAINETALTILDPTMLNIVLKSKAINSVEYFLDLSTDIFRVRFSYLDFRLFVKVIEAIEKQLKNIPIQESSSHHQTIEFNNQTQQHETKFIFKDINISINNLCLFIIDDCRDIDIPLLNIQFNKFKLTHTLSLEDKRKSQLDGQNNMFNKILGRGSVEFALNIDYYNRLLSGWEPLIEPWLSRFNWKFKPNVNYFTITSMDVLNFNVTNPFIDLISGVISNWKDDFYNKKNSDKLTKRNKVFQPYKIVNLTGQPIRFSCFQNTNSSSTDKSGDQSNNNTNDIAATSEWFTVEDKSEKTFNFFHKKQSSHRQQSFRKSACSENSEYNNTDDFVDNKDFYLYSSNYHNANRAHNNLLRILVKNRIRISLDDWSEMKPLTIDKVGTYFRDMKRLNIKKSSSNDLVNYQLPNATCLIFEISLSGNATKVIEIKSPVSIKNCLNYKLQCRIESSINSIMRTLGPLIIEIDKQSEISVPIKYLPCNLWFRPLDLDINKEAQFSDKFINCLDVNQPGQIEYTQINCKLTNLYDDFSAQTNSHGDVFYYFAKIKRINFPNNLFNNEQIPGHFITIEPAFTLLNLLPIEFRYKFTSTFIKNINNPQQKINNTLVNKQFENVISGKIDPYKIKNFRNIDVSKQMDLLLDLDNLTMTKPFEINPAKHLNNFAQNQETSNSPSTNSVVPYSPQSSTSSRAQLPNITQNTDEKNSNTSLSNRKLTILRRINFLDDNKRPIFLIAKIIFKIGSCLNFQKSNQNVVDFNPCPIVVQISSIYCFFNLTGLPLIFRQYGCEESAGQSEDHEIACSNQPLLFSFNEMDSPYACSMRIGKHCNDFNAYLYRKNIRQQNQQSYFAPKWCKPFGLDSGSSYRALHVANNMRDDLTDRLNDEYPVDDSSYLHPDLVYYIGIEIKPGKGLLKETTFVYFSTRYYLVNKSSKDLLVSQYYFIEKQREKWGDSTWSNNLQDNSSIHLHQPKSISSSSSDEIKNSILLLNDSIIQFHWPRADFDQLLSVKIKQEPNYNWSGGFKIDFVNSFYINLRNMFNSDNIMYLKVEIILDNGTFYIVFSDRIDFPFPIRIENNGEVPVYILQSQTLDEKYYINVKPDQILNYSWDEPILDKKLLIGVKGGTKEILDFSSPDQLKHLYYENYFYITFTDYKLRLTISNSLLDEASNNSELVLTFKNNRIFLAKKESGNRDQLWHMTVEGLLVHEGSSPPRELGHNSVLDLSNRYVLDIEDMAPRPNHLSLITLRLTDSRRKNTQRWSFTANNYLCCKIPNMCLQINEFKVNTKVYLGPMSSENSIKTVHRQKVRPGSGHLLLKTLIDGPTKVLQISNVKDKSYLSINWQRSIDEKDRALSNSDTISITNLNAENTTNSNNNIVFEFYINLTGGIGISLIQWLNQEYEELVYAYLKTFEVNFEHNHKEQKLLLSIQSIQVCNQLINSFKQNLLLVQPNNSQTHSKELIQSIKKQEVLNVDFLRRFRHENIFTIEHLIINISDANIQIEEKLLWKIIQFLGIVKSESGSVDSINEEKFKIQQSDRNNFLNDKLLLTQNILDVHQDSTLSNNNFYKSQINNLINNTQSVKYSFNKFQINSIGINLSVYKTSKLSNDLQKIKSTLGIPLIQFENARIECKPFILLNEYDTVSCVLNLISKHYTQELRSHAIRILGSVDFLGNPLGLMVDFKESLTNVLSNGQVTDFVFSITHGVANSVSKFSGSLSDELNELTFDERHQETREQIRNIYNNGSIDHFVGGALGFAVGVIGGALSIATQTYRGFNENGVGGAFSGLGRGAVGTVSKPIVGVLDFATGIASAIRETSKGIYKMEIPRIRETRCCAMPGALLSIFSRSDANGQKILYQVNSYNLNEKYIAIEQLNNSSEPLIGLVTNHRVIFIKSSEYEFKMIFEITYQELKESKIIQDDNGKIILEIMRNNPNEKNQRFKCETKELGMSLENKISYAKANYDETFYNLPNYRDDS